MISRLSLAAAVVLAGTVLAAPAAHAAPKAKSTSAVTCDTAVLASAVRLDIFASPQISGRSLLGQLVVPQRVSVTVDAVAGDNYAYFGVPDLSHTWYQLIPVSGLTYTDRWSGSPRPLTQKAWIHRTALVLTKKWLRCEATLPFVPSAARPQA